MQSTTRWCLNEGSTSSCTYDQNGVFHVAHKPPFVPNRPSKFTDHFSVRVTKRRERDSNPPANVKRRTYSAQVAI